MPHNCKNMRNLFGILIALVLLLCLFILVRAPGDGNLQQVYVIFRHGERSPSETYTNDPFKHYPWPGGWDQLSLRGKRQEYDLGKHLRQRYNWFLEDKYDGSVVHVESSYADRCLMSAELVLAGLFPPKGDEVWNEVLLWQPVPVHSLPRHLDNKIAIKKPCRKFAKLLNDSYESLTNLNVDNRQLYDYLSQHSGDEIRNIRALETLYNTLEIEQLAGFALPEWTKSVFPEQMHDLAAMSLALFTHSLEMKRLHGGVLVGEILNTMAMKRKRMVLYSGHDLTIVTILRVLGFPQIMKPAFSASVLIEAYNKERDGLLIKFYYKRDSNDTPSEMHLHACGNDGCSLSDLRRILKPVIPVDWDAECNTD